MQVTNFFSFTSYLTGLAFLIMAWTTMEYKYHLRLYMSWLSRTAMFIAVAFLGILVLASDFVIAQKYPIPCTPCVQHFWQLLLAGMFLLLTLYWLGVCFLFPPKFNRRNCQKFENELVIALEYGQDEIIQGVIDFFGRSIRNVVKAAPERMIAKKPLTKIESSTMNILNLMGNDYFCKVIVRSNPGVVIALFREMIRQNKYDIGLNFFAGNFITQALLDENSFIYRETRLMNGALSWDKPFLTEIYSNVTLVQKIPDLLKPDYSLTSSWNHKQVHAYAEVLLIALCAALKEGCYNPFRYHRYFEILEGSARRIYHINGMGCEYYHDENHLVYDAVIRFYEQLVQSVAVMDKIVGIHQKYEDDIAKKDITDIIADSIVELMFATSALKTPQETSRSVRRFGFWDVLEEKSKTAYYEMLVKKVCRALYKTFEENIGVEGIDVLIFCLDSYGLKRIKYPSKYICLINRFVIFYARHHLLNMYKKASKHKTLKFPDGITIDVDRKQLRKVSVEDIYGNTHESVLDLVG